MEKPNKTHNVNLEELANVVVDLYKNQQLKRYNPHGSTFRGRGRNGREIGRGPNASNKSRQAEHTETIRRIWIHESVSLIPNHEPLEPLLKKAATFHFVANNNNIKIDVKELREVIDVLKMQITNLVQQNNESLNDEIHKKEQELEVLEATLQKKSIDQHTSESAVEDFNGIAITVLEILHKNDNMSHQLYDLIREKLLPQEKMSNTKTNNDSHCGNRIFNSDSRGNWKDRPRYDQGHGYGTNSHFGERDDRPKFQNSNSYGFRPRKDPNGTTITKEQREPQYVPPHMKSHFDKNKYEKKYVPTPVQTLPVIETLPSLETLQEVPETSKKIIGAWAIPLSQKILENTESGKNKEAECKNETDEDKFKKHFMKNVIQTENNHNDVLDYENDVRTDIKYHCDEQIMQKNTECKPRELNWNVDKSEW